MSKRICEYCNKTLPAVGLSRKNGKSHDDWSTRKFHKKCYFEYLRMKKLEKNDIII
jgi:hypothetical protein